MCCVVKESEFPEGSISVRHNEMEEGRERERSWQCTQPLEIEWRYSRQQQHCMAKHVLSSHLCLFILLLSHSLTRQVPSLWGTRCCYFFHIARHCTLSFSCCNQQRENSVDVSDEEGKKIQGLFCNKV